MRRQFPRVLLMSCFAALCLTLTAFAAHTGTVTGDVVNVRAGPGTGYARLAQVAKDKEVTLLGEESGWYKIAWNDAAGYLCKDYAAASPCAAPNATVVGGNINVRAGAGTQYQRVALVGTGKRVTILETSGSWHWIGFDGKTGYIWSDYLAPDAAAAATAAPAVESVPASSVGEQAAALARQYLGVRYAYGGASPSGFDCSGFTMYLYRQYGYDLPHTASGQYASCGVKVARADLQVGDLVFFTSSGAGGRVNHAALYIGNDQVIHARYSVGKISINSLSEEYYNRNYVGAVRLP